MVCEIGKAEFLAFCFVEVVFVIFLQKKKWRPNNFHIILIFKSGPRNSNGLASEMFLQNWNPEIISYRLSTHMVVNKIF